MNENDDKNLVAEFLLEEYKELHNTLHKNEEHSEKRLVFFVTISTVVLGAIGLLIKEFHYVQSFLLPIYGIIILLLLGLSVIGIVIQERLKKRNITTDGLKKDIDRIRDIFKEIDSKKEVLPLDYSAFINPDRVGESSRGFTTVLHIASVINCIMIGTAAAFFTHALNATNWVVVLIAVLATLVAAIVFIVVYGEKDAKLKCTHAGGLVYKNENGRKVYLVVSSAKNPDKWVLPKGHIEKDESPGFAATREVLEEAGVIAFVEKPLIKQVFDKQGEKIVVQYYSMRLLRELDQGEEDRRKAWLTKSELIQKLSFKDAKKLVSRFGKW